MTVLFEINEIVFAIDTVENTPVAIHKCTIDSMHIYKDGIDYMLKNVGTEHEWGDSTKLVFKTLDDAVISFKELQTDINLQKVIDSL